VGVDEHTKQAYPTDLDDTQWALIAPLLPQKNGTRGLPRIWTLRNIVNAIDCPIISMVGTHEIVKMLLCWGREGEGLG